MVSLSIPTYDGRIGSGTHQAVLCAAMTGVRCVLQQFTASLLAFGFNRLLCNALNLRKEQGVTHFLLLHADVTPLGPNWLTVMLDEMARGGYGALSAVIPIKNQDGLTSTGIDMTGHPKAGSNPWPVRRLTMTEVMGFPADTFTGERVGCWLAGVGRDPVLLINTGLLLLDLREPFVEQIVFNIEDRIVREPDGTYRPYANPEDWNLSRQLYRLGVAYAATRKIRVLHEGTARYPNDQAWGACEMDQVWADDRKDGA